MKLHHDYSPWRTDHVHRSRPLRSTDVWIRASRAAHTKETGYCPSSVAINAVLANAARISANVSIDAEIMDGKPCIIGTRVPVASVLRAIEQYGSIDGAVRCYPHISVEQVKDALYFTQLVLESPDGTDETAVAS